jgi:hypothetical protein
VRARELTRVLLAALALFLLGVGRVQAEPYFSARSGAKCSDCHTNLTGGGKRTAFAHIHAHDILHDLDILPVPQGVRAFNGEINQYLSIGGDLRVRNTTVWVDDPNEFGRVPNNRAFRHKVDSNSTDVNEALGYIQVDLLPDLVTFYYDGNAAEGVNTREVWGMVRGFLPWGTYVKAGKLYPPFGLRVQDDQAFIRQRTGYTFQNADDGGEIGFMPGPFFFATSVTNGSNSPAGDTDVQTAVNGYGVFEDVPVVRNVLAGMSFARQSNKRSVGGFYAGSNLWRFTYLGEFDLIDDRQVSTEGRRDQYAAYAELDLLLLDWLNLRGTFDFVKVSHDQDQTRYAIGAEPFINRVIQPRIQYRINNGVPQRPNENTAELWVELHLFL